MQEKLHLPVFQHRLVNSGTHILCIWHWKQNTTARFNRRSFQLFQQLFQRSSNTEQCGDDVAVMDVRGYNS
jgi:hypothetical protein